MLIEFTPEEMTIIDQVISGVTLTPKQENAVQIMQILQTILAKVRTLPVETIDTQECLEA